MRKLYGGEDPRQLPTYSVGDASRILALSPSTLRSWTMGRGRLIRAGAPGFLSFNELVEAHVLSALRRDHGLKMPTIRRALDFVNRELGVQRPLLEQAFETDGVGLFVEELGRLVNASENGQLAARGLIAAHLARVERDERGLAARLFPFVREGNRDPNAPRLIVIDPRVQFGRPVIDGTGIRVDIVAARYRSGEAMRSLAADYECREDQIEEAIRASDRMRMAA